MPQTREHLDICRLLGVPQGSSRSTEVGSALGLGTDWLPLLEQDVRDATKGTFLEGESIVPVSAASGEGSTSSAPSSRGSARGAERPADGPVFLPRRSRFSMKGFGTVVTRTLLSARSRRETRPRCCRPLPARPAPRPRGAGPREARGARARRPAHREPPGVEASAIAGQALVHAGIVPQSSISTSRCRFVAAGAALLSCAKLLLHVGTAQVPAAVALVDRADSAPATPRSRSSGSASRWPRSPAALHPARLHGAPGPRQDRRGRRILGVAARAGAAAGRRRRRWRCSRAAIPTRASRRCSRWPGPPGSSWAASSGAPGSRRRRRRRRSTASARRRSAAVRPRAALLRRRTGRARARQAARRGGGRVPRTHPLAARRRPRSCAGASPPVTDARLFQRLLAQLAERGSSSSTATSFAGRARRRPAPSPGR